MKVTVIEPDSSETEQPELWIRVHSSQVVDLPDILRHIRATTPDVLRGIVTEKPHRYYPHHVTEQEKAEHGFAYEDWFIFLKRGY